MLRTALIIARKDLRLTIGRSGDLAQAAALGLLLIFIFSLSLAPGQRMSAQSAAAIFWMASAFCQVIIFSMLHAYEENNGQKQGLLLAPMPVQSVWLGKALAGIVLLMIAQALFVPALIVFLGQEFGPVWKAGPSVVLVCDIGIAGAGSLMGALVQGQSGKESLLGILVFPLLTPLFLGGIRVGSLAFGGADEGIGDWMGICLAFDAVFIAAALPLFPFAYNAEG
ncbi:MAG: heme exporter protein CcmB [Desulfovibrio sp.]|jgi:heme exporter protein B|nr:heme exporter protein CcmB [Desulfovibrio sp.]